VRQLADIAKEKHAMGVMVEITGIFESIASMRIAQVRSQVLQAQEFFDQLWHIYAQLRVDALFHFGRSQEQEKQVIDKELYICITAEGGFSGDIDQKLITFVLEQYDKDKNDIIVIGHHGAIQLAQRNIEYKKYFKLPEKDQNINVTPLVAETQLYKNTSVFYQQYKSLMVQEVKKISLSQSVQEQGKTSEENSDLDEIISDANYIFEPSTYEVVGHLEQSMLGISLSQVILESKLAQYASRFRAMSASNQRANELTSDLGMQYNRTRRMLKDERLKEISNGLKHARQGQPS
jgi:ATP synthase F1 gamma subunit